MLGRFVGILIHGQVLMALSASCLLLITSMLLDLRLEAGWYLAAALGVWGLHVLDGVRSCLVEDARSQPVRSAFTVQHIVPLSVMGWSALCLSVLVSLLMEPGLLGLLVLLLLGLLVVSYLVPLFTPSKWSLKSLGLVKTPAVVVAWVLGGVILPVVSSGHVDVPWLDVLVLCLLVSSLLLVDCLVLDSRDIEADAERGIRTIAVRLGPGDTMVICWISVGIAVLAGAVAGAIIDARWSVVALVMIVPMIVAIAVAGRTMPGEVRLVSLVLSWRIIGAVAALIMFP